MPARPWKSGDSSPRKPLQINTGFSPCGRIRVAALFFSSLLRKNRYSFVLASLNSTGT